MQRGSLFREYFQDVFGQGISEGLIFQANHSCYDGLAETEFDISNQLKNSPILNTDETSMRVLGGLKWLHVYATEKAMLAI